MGELGAIAVGGWPAALAMLVAVAGVRLREARRRQALNAALHELRRPLQALALTGSPARGGHPRAGSQLDLALLALADLDGAINGGAAPARPRPVSCRGLVTAAIERRRSEAARAGRSLELRWRAGTATVLADPARAAQALDNLLANAIEHGGLRVVVDASVCAGGVRVCVRDGSLPPARRRHATSVRPLRPGRRDARRGHGLRIVARIASEHGGRLVLAREGAGLAAVLELPLAPQPLPDALVGAAAAG